MKILFVTHFFPPGHPGGTEAYTLGLAQTYRRMGHSPSVLCAENWGSGDTDEPRVEDTSYDGIPVRRLSWNWELAPDPFVNLYNNPRVNHHFSQYVEELRPDVVHVTSCYAFGAGVVRVSHQAGIPTFLTLTDFWFLCPRVTLQRGDGSLCTGPETALKCQMCLAAKSGVYRKLSTVISPDLAGRALLLASRSPTIARRRGLRGYVGDSEARLAFLHDAFDEVDVAIAPSQFLIDMFARNGYPADRIRLSPHGLDLSWRSKLRERSPDGRIRIGYIGQIDPIKGVDLLVQAFQSLGPRASAELRIYGDLDKRPQFGARLLSLAQGNPDIKFMGSYERPQIPDVLSGLDVVAVPSTWYENSPLAIGEALAAQKPVIATNLGGMSEAIQHGVNGLLFERGDLPGLTLAIQRFIEDPGLRDHLRKGIRPVRSVDEEAVCLLDLYAEECRRGAAGGSRSPDLSPIRKYG